MRVALKHVKTHKNKKMRSEMYIYKTLDVHLALWLDSRKSLSVYNVNKALYKMLC